VSVLDSTFDPIVVNKRRVFRRLLAYAKPHARLLTVAFALLFVATAADVIGPLLIKTFIDTYLTKLQFPVPQLLLLGGTYVALLCIAAACNFVQLVTFQKIALHIIQTLRLDVFSKVQHLGLAFFDRTPTGSLISRITNDTESIKDLYVSVLSTFVQNIILICGVFVTMFVLNVRLAMFCLVLLPIIFAVMAAYRHFSFKVFHLSRQRLSQLNAKLNESLQGMYLIQAMRQTSRLRREFDTINQLYKAARLKNIYLNGLLLRPMVDLVYTFTLVGVLSFFGMKSWGSPVDIGVLYAFVNYLDRFFEPLNTMMMRLNLFQQAMVSAERVFELLDETAAAPSQERAHLPDMNVEPEISKGRIVFHDVSFSYDGKTDVLKHISFTAEPGQTVALVGHTGSGKSSIVNLLMRFYPLMNGQITIDGTPLQAYADAELRRKIGLVLQDPFIFVGDLRSNIRLGRTDISNDAVVAAAQFVQADTFIEQLPAAYEESVRERGSTFSSGQKQLLSFARTIAGQPKILVLDEATASIDTETEEAIQVALEKMRKGRTTIAIAHRLSTIQDADFILVLHHGEIVEQGTHQALLAQQGLYHKMYLLQQGAKTV